VVRERIGAAVPVEVLFADVDMDTVPTHPGGRLA
jgi:hypothetical protein